MRQTYECNLLHFVCGFPPLPNPTRFSGDFSNKKNAKATLNSSQLVKTYKFRNIVGDESPFEP